MRLEAKMDDAARDEWVVLESIFGGDYERVGSDECAIRVCEGGLKLCFFFPEGYPASAPPVLTLDSEGPLPDGFARRLEGDLEELWVPGEVCVYEWANAASEAFQVAVNSGVVPEATSGVCDASVSEVAECSVPVTRAVAEKVEHSILACGFTGCGPGLFSHGSKGVTVEIRDSLSITVDGIFSEDLIDFVSLQLQDGETFGAQLLEWTSAQRSAEPGFLEGAQAAPTSDSEEFLPTRDELHVTSRPLLIYTWGKALRKAPPADSQFNFNASVLNGRGGGADLRTQNGLSQEVQDNVRCCGLFPTWLQMVCSKIETSNLHTVSINCTKGRHRSVAAAEILRNVYYPDATIRHLTIT